MIGIENDTQKTLLNNPLVNGLQKSEYANSIESRESGQKILPLIMSYELYQQINEVAEALNLSKREGGISGLIRFFIREGLVKCSPGKTPDQT